MEIHEASSLHLEPWLSLRQKLWPPNESDDFEMEIRDILDSPSMTAFLCYEDGVYIGFAEIAIRDYVDDCISKNVGYLEGIYVEPEYRKRGFAMALMRKAEEWFQGHGCIEIGSDAYIDNQPSIKWHKAAGFTELKPVVRFVKKLKR